MAGYVIAEVEVTDPEKYDVYRGQVGATIEKYGGKYLVRGGAAETAEGTWQPKRLIVLEFDSVARAKEWHDSVEYSGPKELRHQSTNSNMVFVEGV